MPNLSEFRMETVLIFQLPGLEWNVVKSAKKTVILVEKMMIQWRVLPGEILYTSH